ncbi:MAG TPA: hypothetical protein VF623_05260, partial [Segetibacter sp.]
MINHLFKRAILAFIGFFPVRYRLRVILLLSKVLDPFFKLVFFINSKKPGLDFGGNKYENDSSDALVFLLRIAEQMLVTPNIIFDISKLEESLKKGKGVFLACYHGLFMPLIVPHLQANGYNINVWAHGDKNMHFGKLVRHTLEPGTRSFLKVKQCFKNNEIVAAMIDFNTVYNERTFSIPTKFGNMVITDSFFRLANSLEADVIFLKYTL